MQDTGRVNLKTTESERYIKVYLLFTTHSTKVSVKIKYGTPDLHQVRDADTHNVGNEWICALCA